MSIHNENDTITPFDDISQLKERASGILNSIDSQYNKRIPFKQS